MWLVGDKAQKVRHGLRSITAKPTMRLWSTGGYKTTGAAAFVLGWRWMLEELLG